jgi:O-antigen ligase
VKALLIFVIFASTCVSLVGDLGNVRITAVGWTVPLVFAAAGLGIRFAAPSVRLLLWLPWVLFILLSAMASEHSNALHRATIMVTPFLVGSLAASLRVEAKDIRRFVHASIVFALAAALVVGTKAFVGPSEKLLFLAAESQTMVLLAWVLIHIYLSFRLKLGLLAWVLVLSVPVLSVSRAATIAALSCLVLTLAPVGVRFRIRSALAALMIAVGVAFTPGFQEKTFLGAIDLVSVMEQPEAIQTSGRLVAWSILADEIPDAPLLGHGSNSSQTLLRHHIDAFDHPHNDWLRIVFEYGLLGLVLFLATSLTQIWVLLKMGRQAISREAKFACYLAASLFVPYFLLMITDNVLLFAAYFGNIHFLLIGYAISIMRHEDPLASEPHRTHNLSIPFGRA